MVRNYKKKGQKLNYDEFDVARALIDVDKGEPLRVVAARYKIPVTSLHQHLTGRSQSPRKIGHKTALLRVEEMSLVQNLAALGDFGMAFDMTKLRTFVKYYLDSQHRIVTLFHDNLPGVDWARGFLKRHENILTTRMCQNISRKRATVSEADVASYFERLRTTLEGVPPANIINYDETNLTDDPKGTPQIFRKGIKHAERIMNTTKSSTSIMFAITATGEVLQPYVVYKSERLQESWIRGGPIGTVYNRTSSGWFDSDVFLDWVKKVAVQYFCRLPDDEPKVLLGDNLASHMNYKVVALCEQLNIRLVFIPPNATHFLQPLDVAVYGPLKVQWRKIITAWKEGDGKHLASFPKWVMPQLLLQLMMSMEDKWKTLADSGFRACGVYPFNPEHVLAKMQRKPIDPEEGKMVSPELLKFLKETRETSVHHRAPRGGRTYISPGQSVSLKDLEESGPSRTRTTTNTRRPAKRALSFGTEASLSDESDTEEAVTSLADPDEPETLPTEGQSISDTKTSTSIDAGDYILAKFTPVATSKKEPVHFVGRVLGKEGDEFVVTYYRKADTPQGQDSTKVLAFKSPPKADVMQTKKEEIVMKLTLKEARKAILLFNNVFTGMLIR